MDSLRCYFMRKHARIDAAEPFGWLGYSRRRCGRLRLRLDEDREANEMASDPNADITKNQVSAKQGTNRPKVIYVLVASVVLIIVAFFVAYLIGTK